jgi:putative acetyltransferase
MPYTIRRYQERDLEAVLLSWERASRLAHPFLSEDFLAQERANIPTIYLPNTETWVAEQNHTVVGFISLLENEVGALFVQPQYHGTGAGRALMNQAKTRYSVLYVEVFEANPLGRHFYEKAGFQRTHTYLHEPTHQIMLRLKYDATTPA